MSIIFSDGRHCHDHITGIILFSYLTDFSYFTLKIVFRKLLDTVRTGQNDNFERGCRWFQIFKSPKQCLETYCFCSVSYYYFYYYYSYSSPFFSRTMNLSTADLRNYRTEFHETWWSYRYMFLVDPKIFRFVVKGVKAIFLRV